MVDEEGDETDGEHEGDDEEEEDLELLRVGALQAAPPEGDEVGEGAHGDEEAVEEGVGEEEDEALVVAEADAAVDPGAVVVHLEDAGVADGAVVGPVRFHQLALVAVADGPAGRPVADGKVLGEVLEDLPLHPERFRALEQLVFHRRQFKFLRHPRGLDQSGLQVCPHHQQEQELVDHEEGDPSGWIRHGEEAELVHVRVVGPQEDAQDEQDWDPFCGSDATVDVVVC